MLPSPDFIPDAVLERRSLDLLRQHESAWDVRISLPIPIDSTIEKTLQLTIAWVPIQEQPGEIILARLDPDFYGCPTIQMNEHRRAHFEEYFGTEQYSLGHEVGHWLLHLHRGQATQLALEGLDSRGPGPAILCRRMSDGDRREYQAERFAAFLLLPEQILRQAVAGIDLSTYNIMSMLARQCGVSKRALTRRLVELGLANGQSAPTQNAQLDLQGCGD